MKNYETSEQLFIDIWEKYGSPSEIDDAETIYSFFTELVEKSKHYIVLDHYSHINFDEVIKVEYDKANSIFKFYWLDNNKYRIKNLNHELEEFERLIWYTSGYCTYEYMAIDINKIKFIKNGNHIFILIQSNVVSKKELRKKIVGKNEIIEIEDCTDELYARYTFWEGNPENLIKIECIANNLPYYVCVIQLKENIPNVDISKRLLLLHTINEINNRLEKVKSALRNEIADRDELFSKGNIIRNIMEFALKHFCVIMNIPIEIEQKYGFIELGDLRKKIKDKLNIEIENNLIIKANELSHDSGKKYTIDDIRDFHSKVVELINKIQSYIYNSTH